ncbi:MAG: DUF4389 domain-containing protein [Acidobacteria bacterium]|nr:DUF4389 domain-containing protein [Acidobacteriota bacterium]
MAFCTNCGAPIVAGRRYCAVCGHPVSVAAPLTPAPPLGPGEGATSDHARVLVGLAADAPRQPRWSVLVRVVLSLPLFGWLIVVSLAAAVVLVVAWFAALITGRVPDAAQGFVSDVLRYEAKVSAYASLLIDRWPGLSLRAREFDQVSLAIDQVDLNRWSVLFRVVLALPAAFVSGVANVGGYFLTFVMWWCALALGRVPQPLHEARGQIWRFTIRASAFIQLLTPTQPFEGFFGESAAPAPSATPVDPAALSTRATLSSRGKVVFIVTLVAGAYLQVQPGLLRWPLAYAVDRSAGPALVAAINRNIVDDLANYTSTSAHCVGASPGACPLDAATAQYDVDRQRRLLRAFEQFVVEGRAEYFAYEHQVLLIDLTLEQAANAPASERPTSVALVLNEESRLASLYDAVRRAI